METHVLLGIGAGMFALIGFLLYRSVESSKEQFVTGAIVIAIFGALAFGLTAYYEWRDYQCQTNPQYRFEHPDHCS